MKKCVLLLVFTSTFFNCTEHKNSTLEVKRNPAVQKLNNKIDFKSKVPFYTFSNELKEQKKELDYNPLLQRFKASRDKLSNDPY